MNFTQKSLISILGKLVGSIIGLFISVIFARILGVKGVGQYQLFLSTQTVIITIMAMGFGNATIYYINSKKVKRQTVVSILFKLFIIVSIIQACFFGCSIFYFRNYFGDTNNLGLILFVIGSAALLLYNILMPVFYASLEVIKIQILSLSSSITILAALGFFSYFSEITVNNALAIAGSSNLISTVILLYYLRKDISFKQKIDITLLKGLFSYGIKISVTNFVFILSTNLIIFLLNQLLLDGFEAVGLFSRASAIANMFLMFPVTLGPLLYSKWAKTEEKNLASEVEKALRLTIFFSTGCVLVILILGEYLLNILYGPEFILAKNSLKILSVSILFSSITIIFTNLFSSIGRPLITLKVFIVSLLITFLLAVFLIKIQGIEGAAISVLTGIVFNVIALLYFSRKILFISLKNSVFIKKQDISYLVSAFKFKSK